MRYEHEPVILETACGCTQLLSLHLATNEVRFPIISNPARFWDPREEPSYMAGHIKERRFEYLGYRRDFQGLRNLRVFKETA
jgi:hypothetical protein